jgi:hypothetical protein
VSPYINNSSNWLKTLCPGFESLRERHSYSHHCVQTGSGAHPASSPMCVEVPFMEVKRTEHEADHVYLHTIPINRIRGNFTSAHPSRHDDVFKHVKTHFISIVVLPRWYHHLIESILLLGEGACVHQWTRKLYRGQRSCW